MKIQLPLIGRRLLGRRASVVPPPRIDGIPGQSLKPRDEEASDRWVYTSCLGLFLLFLIMWTVHISVPSAQPHHAHQRTEARARTS